MTPLVIQLTKGFKPQELDEKDYPIYKKLLGIGAIEEINGLSRLKSIYRAGELFINKEGKGFLSSLFPFQKDLLIEPKDIGDAKSGDFVVVKRVIARRGRASAKVVMVIKPAVFTKIVVVKKDEKKISFINIKTALIEQIISKNISLKSLKDGDIIKVDAITNEALDVLGNISDPKVDEKISLSLFNRFDKFNQEAIKEAKNMPYSVRESEVKKRVDLRDLSFCTIDPVSAKDFDDAIYWDENENSLYVAIADVSYYVNYYSSIDKEAIKRGFTTYFPHKAYPMLPRELSENICSLKPNVDRLSFIAKIKINPENLEIERAEFFEGIIHSKKRFNYEEIDKFLQGKYEPKNKNERIIFKWLKPLYELTQKLKAKRLKKGFDFRSDEVRIELDRNHLLKGTTIETGTPSHSLIEECMLLANQSAAKRFSGEGDGIFRIHEAPKDEKIQRLINELASIGIFVKNENEDINKLIKQIQEEAKKMALESEVDELIIQSLKQASYSSFNVGHFGLGFEFYSHFTSPIRRYSDLILHRLIKAQLKKDEKELEYLLRNIEPLSARVSELERESTKSEWDFRDRKFARWAKDNIEIELKAKIIEIDVEDTNKGAVARIIEGPIKGALVILRAYKSSLFDDIVIKISEVDILKPQIIATEVTKINQEKQKEEEISV